MSYPRTITEAADALRAGDVTAEQLVTNAIRAADALDDTLGVFITRFNDSALEQAKECDRKINAGTDIGPLAGIPLGIKDIVADSEGPTTAQSLILDPQWAVDVGQAPVLTRLKDAGGIVMGKVTTMEFAIGNPDPSKPFPVPKSAWDAERWAGGSSSGSGSGVASDMFLGALGTDTSGSIRVPAAFNGVTGLKPTFGLVPKSGIAPLGFTNDHPGPMARSAADCALLLSVMAGHDVSDPYSAQQEKSDYVGALTGDLSGLRIGVDRLERAAGRIDANQPGLFDAALRELEAAGAELVDVDIPLFVEGGSANIIIMLSEALAYHRKDLKERWNDYGQATRLIITAVAGISGADYVQAQRVRQVAREQVSKLFETVDLLATPTTHMGPPKLKGLSLLDPFGIYESIQTPYWATVGVPSLAFPIGLSTESTPLSMSLAAPWWQDGLALRAGDAYQQRTTFHLDRSPILTSIDA